MGLTLGVFDVFAYSAPGALYLGLVLYVLDRTAWVDVADISHVNSTILVIAGILASYLLGHLTYLPRRFLERFLPRWLKGSASARAEFLRRVPAAATRRFVDVDAALLLAAIEIKAKESALEISRNRASGIALRNAAFAFLLAAVAAAVGLMTGPERTFAGCCVALFLVGAATSVRSGYMLSRWAVLKTFELAFWLPDIDDEFPPRPVPAPGSTP